MQAFIVRDRCHLVRASAFSWDLEESCSLSTIDPALALLQKIKFKNAVCLKQAVLPLQKWTQPASSDFQHLTSILPEPAVARIRYFQFWRESRDGGDYLNKTPSLHWEIYSRELTAGGCVLFPPATLRDEDLFTFAAGSCRQG